MYLFLADKTLQFSFTATSKALFSKRFTFLRCRVAHHNGYQYMMIKKLIKCSFIKTNSLGTNQWLFATLMAHHTHEKSYRKLKT